MVYLQRKIRLKLNFIHQQVCVRNSSRYAIMVVIPKHPYPIKTKLRQNPCSHWMKNIKIPCMILVELSQDFNNEGPTIMELLHMSRLTQLDVKWTGYHLGHTPLLADYEHASPNFELLVVTEGPIDLWVEASQLELSAGDCLLLLPWERHTAWRRTHPQAGFYWVQFAASPELTAAQPIGHEDADILLLPRRCQPVRRYELLHLMEKLHLEMEHPQGYYRYRSSLLLGDILLLLAEDLLQKEQHRPPVSASYRLYRQLVNYLNETYNREIKREHLEGQLQRKYEYLCHIFKKYAGTTIIAYIHKLRMQQAKYLLANTDLEIQQIAEAVGFQDPYYFSRLFKRMEQVSPTDYRRRELVRRPGR